MSSSKPSGRSGTIVGDLRDLDRHLRRQRARAGRLWRRYQATEPEANQVVALAAHQAWSDAVEEAIATAEKISRQRPTNLADLLIQYEATWWWVVEDDSILDGSARRWLSRFRRSLRGLVNGRLT